MGAHLNAFTSRELTIYYMQVFKKNVKNAVDILGDMLLNSLYRTSDLEAEKGTILQELEEVNKDPMEVLLENVYFAAYRDHMMGQPILGARENICSVTRDMVTNFHQANYIGENMIIVGTGDVEHKELVDLVKHHFANCHKISPEGLERAGLDKPIFNPGLTMQRDDEMENCCTGVFYRAPSWMHEDYYSFLLLERIFGTYSVEQNFNKLNDVEKQYNSFAAFLAKRKDIIKQQAIYSPYSDCGLFGNYFMGNEAHAMDMTYCGLHFPTKFSDYIDDIEVARGKQKVYHELASLESTAEIMQTIGQQVLYWNRRVPCCEIAKRIASISPKDIKNTCYKWFYDGVTSLLSL
jgi:processing peptidase subunit beta